MADDAAAQDRFARATTNGTNVVASGAPFEAAITDLPNLAYVSFGTNASAEEDVSTLDEPYAGSAARNVSAADIQAATDEVRASFPGKMTMLTLDGYSVFKDSRAIRTSGPSSSRRRLPASAGARTRAPTRASPPSRRSIAASPRTIHRAFALMNFGWWLGSYVENGEPAGDPDPIRNLPATADAQQRIGRSVLGL